MIKAEHIYKDLEGVRRHAPLVHNITNYVVMNNTANALLAVGASPVMAHAPEEVEEMVQIASALVVNIGTLSKDWIKSMDLAMAKAKEREIPVIFDPVGVGATSFRNNTAEQLLDSHKPDIIRGNASEIMALAKKSGQTKGVDTLHDSADARDAAQLLAEYVDGTVIVSGAVDYVFSRNFTGQVNNGDPLMGNVTGMGCTASAIIGAFASVNRTYGQAALYAMAVMGIAGELAAEQAEGPGSLQMHFLDALYQLTQQHIAKSLKASS